eukprot:410247-Prorocentrum_minimum.AAC.5
MVRIRKLYSLTYACPFPHLTARQAVYRDQALRPLCGADWPRYPHADRWKSKLKRVVYGNRKQRCDEVLVVALEMTGLSSEHTTLKLVNRG